MKFPLMKNNIQAQDLEPVIQLCNQNDPKLTSGPSVKEFERQWSDWLGVKYSVFVNSGSSANLLAMAWLKTKFPDGGRVILPPLLGFRISSALWMGFELEFVTFRFRLWLLMRISWKTLNFGDVRAIFLTHAQGIVA